MKAINYMTLFTSCKHICYYVLLVKEYGVVFTFSIEWALADLLYGCMLYSYINRRLYTVIVSFMSCMLWLLVIFKIWFYSLLLSHIRCCSLVVWIISCILFWYVNTPNDLILVIFATNDVSYVIYASIQFMHVVHGTVHFVYIICAVTKFI
jgi:hypothetical protein